MLDKYSLRAKYDMEVAPRPEMESQVPSQGDAKEVTGSLIGLSGFQFPSGILP